MLNALLTAASGMAAQQINMDAIANNLANVNTTGFKRAKVQLGDAVYADARSPVAPGDTGLRMGYGVRVGNIARVFTVGAPQTTDNPYDLNIEGPGFFRVQGNGTEAYSRDGSFHLDGAGNLVTDRGELVMGEKGPIQLPAAASKVQIASDGTVSYLDSAQTDPSQQKRVVADRISVATFQNPAGLQAMGDNRWAATAASGQAQVGAAGANGAGAIRSGELEGSNVSVMDEMVSLLVAQRAYQLNSKVIQSADEMMSIANSIFRG